MVCPFDYLIVVDFEATCDDGVFPQLERDEAEIIEVPFVVINTHTCDIVHRAQHYCRPVTTCLTDFCEKLTGITYDTVKDAGSLSDALCALEKYVRENIQSEGKSFCLVCDGRWDLGIQLPREARLKGIVLPSFFGRYFDVKIEFVRFAKKKELLISGRTISQMCETLGIVQEGRAHSGLDDSVNIAKIVIAILRERLTDIFCVPEDTVARIAAFMAQKSPIVMLRGVAFRASHEDIVAWIRKRSPTNTLMPAKIHVITEPHESRPSGNVFVEFPTHESAVNCLLMNGFVMGNSSGRYIEVYPSFPEEFKATENVIRLPEHNPHHSHHNHHGHHGHHNSSHHNSHHSHGAHNPHHPSNSGGAGNGGNQGGGYRGWNGGYRGRGGYGGSGFHQRKPRYYENDQGYYGRG